MALSDGGFFFWRQIMDREVVKISSLKAAPYNPRQISGEALAGLSKSLERWGVVQEVVANRRTGYIVGGHQRVAALKKMGVKEVPVVWVDLDEVEEKALNVALNNPHISGEFDDTIAGLLTEIRDGIGPDDFAELKLDDLLPQESHEAEDSQTENEPNSSLSDRFGAAPFSVLNAREGWWQDRKRAWLALGIKSELGRGENND